MLATVPCKTSSGACVTELSCTTLPICRAVDT
jgi:hypothetical protein